MVPSQSPKPLRAAAFDMDGTLLNSAHALSETTIAKVRAHATDGLFVMLATGRSGPAVYEKVRELALPQPLPALLYNGAVGVLFPAATEAHVPPKELFTLPVPLATVHRIIKWTADHRFVLQYYIGDDIYAVCTTDDHFARCRRYTELTGARQKFVDSYDEALARGLPYKLLVLGPDADELYALANRELPTSEVHDAGGIGRAQAPPSPASARGAVKLRR